MEDKHLKTFDICPHVEYCGSLAKTLHQIVSGSMITSGEIWFRLWHQTIARGNADLSVRVL